MKQSPSFNAGSANPEKDQSAPRKPHPGEAKLLRKNAQTRQTETSAPAAESERAVQDALMKCYNA